MKAVSIKVSKGVDAKLTALAQRRKTTKSALVRAALDELVDRGGAPRAGSALELAGDLVGCLRGPVDLSTNKDHLKAFGR
jgi:predicted transcriptional regulator